MTKTFEYGRIYLTRGVNDLVAEDSKFAKFVMKSMGRHIHCDWGELVEEDKQANDEAVEDGNLRILSAYSIEGLPKIWIITEADRSATTILFPDDY